MASSPHTDDNPGDPSTKVLNTPELLDNILSFLPLQQVLGKARVSRKWKSVVDYPPQIQQAVFLRPHSNKVVSPAYYMLPDDPERYSKKSAPSTSTRRPVYAASIELNPLVGEGSGIAFPFEMHTGSEQQHNIHSELPHNHTFLSIVGKYSRKYIRQQFGRKFQPPQARFSWREMFLTSPPITEIVLATPVAVGPQTGSYGQDRLTPIIHILIKDEDGLTLGLVRDEVDKILGELLIRDDRDRERKLKAKDMRVEDFVDDWGKVDHVMFITTTDTRSIGDHGSRTINGS